MESNLRFKPQIILAGLITLGFFLPWAQIFGFGVSGYNLGQFGSYGNYAWLILLSSVITIVLCSIREIEGIAIISQYITGALPIIALFVLIHLFGKDIFQMLSLGFCLCFFAGMALLFVAFAETLAYSGPKPLEQRRGTGETSRDADKREAPGQTPNPKRSNSPIPYDRKKWLALIRFDDEIRAAANKVRGLGEGWEDELARAYLQLNEKAALDRIVGGIVRRAQTGWP